MTPLSERKKIKADKIIEREASSLYFREEPRTKEFKWWGEASPERVEHYKQIIRARKMMENER